MKKSKSQKSKWFWLSETAAGGRKGELVLWIRGEGRRGGLKTLMVTIETEMLKTKSPTLTGEKKSHAFTHMKTYIHNKKKKNAHRPAHSRR